MADGDRRATVRGVQILFEAGAIGGLADGALLRRFAGRRDGGGEAAFALLVERHGPMVLRACRSSLGNEHDAEDAFQAVFLVLARRARSVWVRDSLGPWLHAVAVRTSARLRSQIERQRRRDRRFAEKASPASDDAGLDDDLARAIHEEVGRLPDRFRVRGLSGKWILREAARALIPERVRTRPKVGFRVPVNEWLRGQLRGYLLDHLRGPSSRTRGTMTPAAVPTRIVRLVVRPLSST